MSIVCHADISKNTNFQLKHNFTIFKDQKLVFTTISDKGDAQYEIPRARSSDSGDYKCTVEANGKTKSSDILRDVWITGEYSFKYSGFLRYGKRTTLQGK